jgi:predicted transcriptional regulator
VGTVNGSLYGEGETVVELSELEEKAWKYLVEHKTPVTAKTLAKRWIRSESNVRGALHRLEENGLADVIKIGSTKYYKFKD